eukprot:3757319-Pleurochrysis_carterae.AAC.1
MAYPLQTPAGTSDPVCCMSELLTERSAVLARLLFVRAGTTRVATSLSSERWAPAWPCTGASATASPAARTLCATATSCASAG